jgi:hypothetical protein
MEKTGPAARRAPTLRAATAKSRGKKGPVANKDQAKSKKDQKKPSKKDEKPPKKGGKKEEKGKKSGRR